jgi:purine-nucleoside phosphorylase
MEAAALFAVAKFRGVELAQILYAGDDLSGELWDSREWQSRVEVREELVRLAMRACALI